MMCPSGRKPFQWIRTSLLKRWLRIRPRKKAQNWPVTVAMAAPLVSSRGNGPTPRISSGSRIMLMIAPVSWVVIESVVLPVDCISRSVVIWPNTPSDAPAQIVR